MTNLMLTILCSLLVSFTAYAAPTKAFLKQVLHLETSRRHTSDDYRNARVQLFNKIYIEKDQQGFYISGVYCEDKHYPFMGQDPAGRLPNPATFNTEHVWPQSKFSGRHSKNVQKSDLHHLFPTFSRINSQRGNLPFAEVRDEKELFCEGPLLGSPLDSIHGMYFEPPDKYKGNVARAMFYFSIRYQMEIDPIQEQYLRIWHEEDPVDQTERIRHEKIAQFQNNRNPFIDDPQLVSEIDDF
jgi:hypothetical protein